MVLTNILLQIYKVRPIKIKSNEKVQTTFISRFFRTHSLLIVLMCLSLVSDCGESPYVLPNEVINFLNKNLHIT